MRSRIRSNRTVRAALSELEGLRARGQRPEPPSFHPFPARMPVSVVEHLITRVTSSDALILDPMAGSGTTLIAAKRLGRHSLGIERDPLALRIARSAITDFDPLKLERLGARILSRARVAVSSGRVRLHQRREEMRLDDRRFIDYWFPTESQTQLCALADAIEDETKGKEKDFAWVVFSSLIISKSAGASLALDLSRSRPHKHRDKEVVLPFDGWGRRFRTAVTRLPFKNTGGEFESTVSSAVRRGDARKLSIKDQIVDLVLTSPPYLNAIDYLRAHKFSLVWMGHTLTELRELRGTMIGSERGLWDLDGLPPDLENRMDYVLKQGRVRAQHRRYLSDLATVLAEIARVLRPGGLVFLAVGPTIISSKRTDAASVVTALGERVGLRLVGSIARQLRAKDRSLPLPLATGTSGPLSLRMRREVIVALRK